MKPCPVMRWRRRQARWKSYRLHRARRIIYRIPALSGPPMFIGTDYSFYANEISRTFVLPPHMLRGSGQP